LLSLPRLNLCRASLPERASTRSLPRRERRGANEGEGEKREGARERESLPLAIVGLLPNEAATHLSFSTLTSTPSTKKTSATVAEDAKPWCASGVGAGDEAQGGSIVGEEKRERKRKAMFEPRGPSPLEKEKNVPNFGRVKSSRTSEKKLLFFSSLETLVQRCPPKHLDKFPNEQGTFFAHDCVSRSRSRAAPASTSMLSVEKPFG
jgi:hypothetical protein